MSEWPSTKSRHVFATLLRLGWRIKHQRGSHIVLENFDGRKYIWAFHDGEEIGPRMLARISKRTGLTPDNL